MAWFRCRHKYFLDSMNIIFSLTCRNCLLLRFYSLLNFKNLKQNDLIHWTIWIFKKDLKHSISYVFGAWLKPIWESAKLNRKERFSKQLLSMRYKCRKLIRVLSLSLVFSSNNGQKYVNLNQNPVMNNQITLSWILAQNCFERANRFLKDSFGDVWK